MAGAQHGQFLKWFRRLWLRNERVERVGFGRPTSSGGRRRSAVTKEVSARLKTPMDGAVTAMRAKTRGTLAFSRRSSEAIHVASATHLTHSLSELDLSPMIPSSTQELLEWINEGRPPTPEKQQVDDEEVAKKKAFLAGRQRRSHQLLGSTSLPELPALHVRMPTRPTTADLQERQRRQLAAANPSPEDKRSRKKGRSPGRASVAAAAASAERKGQGAVGYTPPQPPTLRSQRSQRLAKMAVVDSVGLDSTSTWRFAGQVTRCTIGPPSATSTVRLLFDKRRIPPIFARAPSTPLRAPRS